MRDTRGATAMDEGEGERGGEEEEGIREQRGEEQQQQRGMWHQLLCPRLAGLKGCDSLAS